MRKIALICTVLGLSCSFAACSSDDDSSSKAAVGESCTANADCESNVCDSATKKCIAKSDKKDDVDCSADNAKEGDVCGSDKTCQKGDDGKLVCKDKVADTDVDCSADNAKEGDVCGSDKTCQKGDDGKLVCKNKVADTDVDCAADNAKEGDVCGSDKTCQKGDDGKLVCKNKVADTDVDCSADNAKEGDVCGSDKTCQKGDDGKLVCKDKVADTDDGCSSDDDCLTSFPKCDTEAKKCYKLNESYVSACEHPAGQNPRAYYAEYIYDDGSESRMIYDECKGETPICKIINSVATCVQEISAECGTDKDCKSGEICNSEYKCVPNTAKADPCEDITCAEGTCSLGVCVTDAMKALKAGAAWPADTQDFCVGDVAYYQDNEKVAVMDCKDGNWGTCVRYQDPEHEDPNTAAPYIVDCSGSEAMLNTCKTSLENGVTGTKMCFPDNSAYMTFLCINDVTGSLVAAPMNSRSATYCKEDSCTESNGTVDCAKK